MSYYKASWEDPSRCIVCSSVMLIDDPTMICSASCEDLRELEESSREAMAHSDSEDELYA